SGTVTDSLSGVASMKAAVDTGALSSMTVGAGGVFEYTTTLPLDGSANGPHVVHFRATDRASNAAALDFAFTLQVPTGPPGAPTVALLSADDSGASNTDNLTNVRIPRVIVTAATGATVLLSVDGAQVRQGIASGGSMQFTLDPLADGPHTVTAKAQN